MIPQPQAFEVEGGTWAAKAQASGRNSGAAQLNKVFSAQLPVLIYNTQKEKEKEKEILFPQVVRVGALPAQGLLLFTLILKIESSGLQSKTQKTFSHNTKHADGRV